MLMCRSRAKPSLVEAPCLKFPFRMPLGAPPPAPCILQTRFPRTAGPRQGSPVRLDLAPQRAAAFSRWVSKRAYFFGRMGLSHKHKADAGLTPFLALYEPADNLWQNPRQGFFVIYCNRLCSNPVDAART